MFAPDFLSIKFSKLAMVLTFLGWKVKKYAKFDTYLLKPVAVICARLQ